MRENDGPRAIAGLFYIGVSLALIIALWRIAGALENLVEMARYWPR